MASTTQDYLELLKKFFGLNQYEARAYVALLKKPMSAGEISVGAKIPKPRVYDVVRSLEAKGFVKISGGLVEAISPDVALPARR
ncbi:MAG: helix-turn-helix domain-containing protein, partial [Thermoprotei archaeon]